MLDLSTMLEFYTYLHGETVGDISCWNILCYFYVVILAPFYKLKSIFCVGTERAWNMIEFITVVFNHFNESFQKMLYKPCYLIIFVCISLFVYLKIESDVPRWNCWTAPEPVARHVEDQGLEFLQFAFRWFNCLLIREVCSDKWILVLSNTWSVSISGKELLISF